MGKGKGIDATGVKFADHIKRMVAALQSIAEEIEREVPFLSVNVRKPPESNTGTVTDGVFPLIDGAELAVMDLSYGSENVMYELAMFHALGKPTLPVLLSSSTHVADPPFYLKECHVCTVPRFTVVELRKALRKTVRNVVLGTDLGHDPAMNPMTRFYGLPLTDVSATTGIATGYVHNFVQHVIRSSNGGVFARLGPEVKSLVILRPERLADIDSMRAAVERRLASEGLEFERVKGEVQPLLEVPDQARKEVIILRCKNYLFDVPSPLVAQLSSPRYRRVLSLQTQSKGPKSEEVMARVRKIEEQLIDHFFDKVVQLVQVYVQNVSPEKLEFKTLDEFVAMLKS